MKCEGWKKIALQEIIQFKNGKKRPTENGTVPVYGGNGILGFCNQNNYEKVVAIGRVGAYCGSLYLAKGKCWISDNAIAAQNKTGALLKYIFYLLKWLRLNERHIGTGQPLLTQEILNNIVAVVPEYPEQKAIADTLSCLDDKIELNNRMNRTLEEIAQAIFKSWFVDFEPFQDGEFVDSELGKIPKGWRVGTLGECIELFDSQRVPLSSRQRENMKKTYPYYGATSMMDYVDNYLFDGMYVLLGEDGSVVDDNGYPILQYVWGKFWVNNHAHILKGKSGFNEDSLYMLLRNTNVRGAVTGAVQLKINQANLKALKVLIPSAVDLEKYNSLLEPIFAFRRSCSEETQKLILTRDSLLPKLMSGEIRVSMEAK